jgi:hypothetical protein
VKINSNKSILVLINEEEDYILFLIYKDVLSVNSHSRRHDQSNFYSSVQFSFLLNFSSRDRSNETAGALICPTRCRLRIPEKFQREIQRDCRRINLPHSLSTKRSRVPEFQRDPEIKRDRRRINLPHSFLA